MEAAGSAEISNKVRNITSDDFHKHDPRKLQIPTLNIQFSLLLTLNLLAPTTVGARINP